jgi:predicted PurR-regulated permease PerM
VEDDFRRWKEEQLTLEALEGELRSMRLENIKTWLKERMPDVANRIAGIGLNIVNLLIQFGFSLLLSFFIVFDGIKLRRAFRNLEESPVRDFYREIAPGLIGFGRLIGRAFQAQGVIAICNTLLTFTAIKTLMIQNEVFLSAIVFICSFIPVLGVVISSVPIAIMAVIQPVGSGMIHDGFLLALAAVGAVLVVHFIETSILNPMILGDMLHLHPVMVLGILAVGEYFFGVWGLLLGVPVSVYIFRCVLLQEEIDFSGKKPPPGGKPPGLTKSSPATPAA